LGTKKIIDMKRFDDLEFNLHPMGSGVQALIEFENSYGASVVRTPYTYGGGEGLYELAVFKDGEIHYDNPIADGDVKGYLTEEDVSNLLAEIQLL
jgi:hypothetical protein